MQIYLLFGGFDYFGHTLRNGIGGPYDSSIFSFLRNLQTAFHNGCTNLHLLQYWIGLLPCPHLHQQLLFVFLVLAILTEVRWNLNSVWICILLISKIMNFFHIFNWPFALWKSFFSVHLPIYWLYLFVIMYLAFWVHSFGLQLINFCPDFAVSFCLFLFRLACSCFSEFEVHN
jgi:hypothetical protein